MWELSRITLRSVGPKGARYHNTTLDFRNLGERFSGPAQASLLPADDTSPQRRPSPASVLLLENGGGKSVLLKLIFSVILPDKRHIVGTTNTRVLENFVLAADTSHVVLEWCNYETGEQLLTGSIMQWRSHSASGDSTKLLIERYSLRPDDELNLDTLPFAEVGARLHLTAYRDKLSQFNKNNSSRRFTRPGTNSEWTKHLNDLGLDPTRFIYQRAMNIDEGEAADIFKFANDAKFVEWLLKAVSDTDDLNQLGDTFVRYRSQVLGQSDLLLQNTFVGGALDKLTALTPTIAEHSEATGNVQRAQSDIVDLAGQIQARIQREHNAIEQATTAHEQLRQAASHASDIHDYELLTVKEIRRLTAIAQVDDAKQQLETVKNTQNQLNNTIAAWSICQQVINRQKAQSDYDQLSAAVAEAEADAAPAAARRMQAASHMLMKLNQHITDSKHQAQGFQKQLEDNNRSSTSSSSRRDEVSHAISQATAHADNYRQDVEQVEAAIAKAVAAKLITGIDEVFAQSLRAAQAAETAAYAVTGAQKTVHDARMEHKRATEQQRVADTAVSQAERELHRLSERIRNAQESLDNPEHAPRLLELLEADAISTTMIDDHLEKLLELLHLSITQRETRHLELSKLQHDNQRIRTALGEDGLLPARREVIDVVDTLKQAGIAAFPAWDYVSSGTRDATERAHILRSHPELADGVLINDSTRLEQVKQIVREAKLFPQSVVLVSTPANLLAENQSQQVVLVPPNPALFDADAAKAERANVQRLHQELSHEIGELSALIAADRTLLAILSAWRGQFPVGEIQRLTDDFTQAQEVFSQRQADSTAAQTYADATADNIDTCEQLLAGRQQELLDANELRHTLAELSDKAENRIALLNLISDCQRIVADNTRELAYLDESLLKLSQQRDQLVAAAETCRAQVSALQQEHAIFSGIAHISSDTDTDEVSQLSLEQLRSNYQAADETYQAVEVGADLRNKCQASETALAQAHRALSAVDQNLQNYAQQLLLTPEGASEQSRSAALDQTCKLLDIANADHEKALRSCTTYELELKSVAPPAGQSGWVTLPAHHQPTGIEHGFQLFAEAEARSREALVNRDLALAAVTESQRQIDHTYKLEQEFIQLDELIRALIPDVELPTDREPYAGTSHDAREAKETLRHKLAAAEAAIHATTSVMEKAIRDIQRFATSEEFAQATWKHKTLLAQYTIDDCLEQHHVLIYDLQSRQASMSSVVKEIVRHREMLIVTLSKLVSDAFTTIQLAQRLSQLPMGLGDWSGQKFLRIRFDNPPSDFVHHTVGAVIDQLAHNDIPRSAGKTADTLHGNGEALLLHTVMAVVPKGFKVDVLKPDSVLRTERVPVAHMNDVFSGGQRLTAAIILYCTMVALRAHEQGTSSKHAGVLFLDNPIGRASAGYLLELQLNVAKALGVQLVYTTGLLDTTALSMFPLLIRMRNDADLRAGMKYIRVADEVKHLLPPPYDGAADDLQGTVYASSFYRKPEEV